MSNASIVNNCISLTSCNCLLYFIVVKYYIEVHTSEAEMTAATNANVFITLYGSQSDSGRRHLIHSKDSKKRFQAGQVSNFGVLQSLCNAMFGVHRNGLCCT